MVSFGSFWQGIIMVSEWTWIGHGIAKFDPCYKKYVLFEFMIVSSSQNRFRKGAKSASGVPGPKSTPRGSKSTTFSKGICQAFELRNSSLIQ